VTPGAYGTVLLVESDDRLRGLARCVLDWNGYRVIEADSGSMALALAEHHASSINLMVADIGISGDISARQLADKLQSVRPGLKGIYTLDPQANIAGRGGMEGMHFVPKPYKPAMLLAAVQGLMAQDS